MLRSHAHFPLGFLGGAISDKMSALPPTDGGDALTRVKVDTVEEPGEHLSLY